MTMERPHQEFEELAAGHALDALEPDDEQRFLNHLGDCPRCRAALDDFRAVAAQLAYAPPPVEPPARLHAAILAGIGSGVPAARPAGPAGTRRPGRRARLSAGPAAGPSRRWAGAVALAAALAVLAGSVTWAVNAENRADRLAAAARDRAAVLAAVSGPDARVVRLSGPGASGAAVVSAGRLYLLAGGLPVNDRTRVTYVLWAGPSIDRVAGVVAFDVTGPGADGGGDGVTVIEAGPVPAGLGADAVFAVSREPGRTIPARPSNPVLTPA
jgi:hypothetical protein